MAFQNSSSSITSFVVGKQLNIKQLGAAALTIMVIVVASFLMRFGQPVPGKHATYFMPQLMNQNIDTPGWITTGLLLPTSSTVTRAPRPLYPAAITAGQAAGLIENHSLEESADIPPEVWNGAVKALAIENILLAIASLWLFMALCRYYGMSYFDSLAAAVFAGTCFGFNFWVAQLTPEILTFFAVVALFVLMIWAEEVPAARSRTLRWLFLGGIVGIFLLGKELYFLVLFACLILLWKRRWSSCVAFVLAAALPVVVWRLYVTRVLEVFDPDTYNKNYGYFVWLKETLFGVSFSETISRLADNLLRQIQSFFEAFLYYPVIAMLYGLYVYRPKKLLMPLLFFGFAFSAMYFGSNFIRPRISFMAWPVVCAFAWSGISAAASRLKKKNVIQDEKKLIGLKIALLTVHTVLQCLPIYYIIDYG